MLSHKSQNNNEEIRVWIKSYLQGGDKSYLGNIYEHYKRQLFFHCLKLMKNEEEARDLTSDAFIKAFENLSKFNLKKPFYTWLAQIATNLGIDHIRRKTAVRFEQLDQLQIVSERREPLNEIENKELQLKIMNAIRKLKRAQQRCFCLFFIHKKSYQEIAQFTGYSLNEVRSHIQNGKRIFKLVMEK